MKLKLWLMIIACQLVGQLQDVETHGWYNCLPSLLDMYDSIKKTAAIQIQMKTM